MQAKKYQIFVSSTYLDLVKERQDAIKAIVDLGHMPAGMEGFPAIDMEQFEYIKKVIDQCDYYVLIIGDRYGSLAPDGMSFTEKEYHYAIKTGRVVLAFVKNSSTELVDSSREEKRFRKFRDHVRINRIIHEWNSGDDLKYPVSRSLREAFDQHPRDGWVRAATAVKPDDSAQASGCWLWLAAVVVLFAALVALGVFEEKPTSQTSVQETTPKALTSSAPQLTPQMSSDSPKASKNDISSAEKLEIWRSVATIHMSDFSRALIDGYSVQQHWDTTGKTNRANFLARLPQIRQEFTDASQRLEKLRQDYPQYRDVSDGLTQPRTHYLLISLDGFIQDFGSDPDHPPDNYATKMPARAEELKRQLDMLRDWNIVLRQLAATKQKELQ